MGDWFRKWWNGVFNVPAAPLPADPRDAPDYAILEDRTARLFGRRHDTFKLFERGYSKGLTAIVGDPQVGKSWLIMETARRLADQGFLVGFFEARGRAHDHLLRAIIDLWQRWFADADALSRRHEWPGSSSARICRRTSSGLIGEIAKELPLLAKPRRGGYQEGARWPGGGQPDLASGNVALPALQYDRARELLIAVEKITGRSDRAIS